MRPFLLKTDLFQQFPDAVCQVYGFTEGEVVFPDPDRDLQKREGLGFREFGGEHEEAGEELDVHAGIVAAELEGGGDFTEFHVWDGFFEAFFDAKEIVGAEGSGGISENVLDFQELFGLGVEEHAVHHDVKVQLVGGEGYPAPVAAHFHDRVVIDLQGKGAMFLKARRTPSL